MAKPDSGGIWRGLRRLLRRAFAVDPGPANLAEEVADRLLARLTPQERMLLRKRFGVDPETNSDLEQFGAYFSETRQRIREIEAAALIRLYRWEEREYRLPAVQRRLAERIAAAHDEILETLSDAPPLRPVLVGWHDQLVDNRRAAVEIAETPVPAAGDGPDRDAQPPELMLAAGLRTALWANARARKAVRDADGIEAVRVAERAKALAALRAIRLNSQSIDAVAESLLSQARRLNVESTEPVPPLLDPAEDRDAPVPPENRGPPAAPWQAPEPDAGDPAPLLVEIVTAESGMTPCELRDRGGIVASALARARHNRLLLAESCMPLVAGIAVSKGLRGKAFFSCVEQGRAAILDVIDRYCFAGGADFSAAAERALRRNDG